MKRLQLRSLVLRRDYHVVLEQVPPEATAENVIESIQNCSGIVPAKVTFESHESRRIAFIDLASVSYTHTRTHTHAHIHTLCAENVIIILWLTFCSTGGRSPEAADAIAS